MAINPYLQATANFAHRAAKDGENAGLNGSLDGFIERLARFMASVSNESGIGWMNYEMYDKLTVSEFEMMCYGYGIYQAYIGPTARDWFVTYYKQEYNRFAGWE